MVFLVAGLLSDCDAIDNLPATFQNKPSLTLTPGATNTPTPLPILSKPSLPAGTPDPSQGLTIWLPPELNPASGSPAAKLVAQRLESFQNQNGGIKILVRIKNLTGPQGMLDTLTITRQAAPLAMPSIVVLQRTDLESAVNQNLVYPIASLQNLKDTSDWYPYCQALAQVNQKWYGVPFSGDALILVYHPDTGKKAISTWDDVINLNQPVLFPASDPDALTTLALYQSISSEINPASSTQPLQENDLVKVFTFYQHAAHQGIFTFSLSQYDSFDQTWTAFNTHQAHLVISWASTYLKDADPQDIPLPLPGLNGTPYTLATGNMFALSESNPDRQSISLKLIDYLIEPGFLSQLSLVSDHLPTRISANLYPTTPQKQALFDQVSKSAHLQPVLPVYLPIVSSLKEATLQVIRFQMTPQDAANSVLNITPKTP